MPTMLTALARLKWVIISLVASTLLPVTGYGEAHAQMSSSNCIAMGGGMVHCDTMTMGGADQPAHQSSGDGQAVLGEALGKLIFGDKEKSFRKKIGKMLAEGNCQGAAVYAYESGRLELGSEIAQSCQPASRPTSAGRQLVVDPAQLESSLQRLAANAKIPMALDGVTTITKVEAIGKQLLFTAVVDNSDAPISDATRLAMTSDMCADEASPTLLRAGASLRIVYFEQSGKQIGSVMVTREECGL